MKISLPNLLNPSKFIPTFIERHLTRGDSLPPYSVELHLTSTCNYKCYHCSYANRNKANVRLEEDIIDDLLEDLTGPHCPQGIYFSGGGEPTTLKKWDQHLKRVLDSEIATALVTNGSLINESHMPVISRLQYIAVSIYSTQQSTYERITNGNNFHASFSLPSIIKQWGHHPVVGARCVINKFNYKEIAPIYSTAIESGYDYVIFIPEVDYEKKGITLTAEEIGELISNCESTEFSPQKTNIIKMIKNKFNYYKKEEVVSPATCLNCQALELRTNVFINYDGGVYLCQPLIGNAKFCIGNLNNKRFSEIWNSSGHQEVIDHINKTKWKAGLCESCRCISYNSAVQNFINTPNNVPIEITKDYFL